MNKFKQGDVVRIDRVADDYTIVAKYKPHPNYSTPMWACKRIRDGYTTYFYEENIHLKVGGVLLTGEINSQKTDDKLVTHPDHYTAGGIETRDYIKAKLNAMPFLTPWQAYCLGTAMKYQPRAGLKNRDTFTQDLEKSITYTKWAFEDEK